MILFYLRFVHHWYSVTGQVSDVDEMADNAVRWCTSMQHLRHDSKFVSGSLRDLLSMKTAERISYVVARFQI